MKLNKKNFGVIGACLIATGIVLPNLSFASTDKNIVDPFVYLESKEDLIQYISDNEVKKENLYNSKSRSAEKILTTITFSKYLSEKEFKSFLDTYSSIDASTARARCLESDGTRGTVGVDISNGVYDNQYLNQVINSENIEFKGFIEVEAEVDKELLNELSNDSMVFSVDVGAEDSLVSNSKKDTMSGLFWYLEDFNMIK